jgi:mono/diheme cytochrome c family protein
MHSRLAMTVFCVAAASGLAQDAGQGSLSVEEARKLHNPIPYSKKSIASGRGIYARMCVGCHGSDGKATVDVVADATDLTSPKIWKNGTSDGEIFRSIRDGQGASMPAFKTQIRQEDDIWRLVNFIRSLWPESTRPQLQESDK